MPHIWFSSPTATVSVGGTANRFETLYHCLITSSRPACRRWPARAYTPWQSKTERSTFLPYLFLPFFCLTLHPGCRMGAMWAARRAVEKRLDEHKRGTGELRASPSPALSSQCSLGRNSTCVAPSSFSPPRCSRELSRLHGRSPTAMSVLTSSPTSLTRRSPIPLTDECML